MSAPCKLCEKKRGKRYCPGLSAEICPACCGAERENSIACPLDCEFLRESRLHEHRPPVDESAIPNGDIRLTEKFMREQEPVIMFLCFQLRAAMEQHRAVDLDVREGIESLIRTYRTLESGLIYETRPANPYAAAIQDELKKAVDDLRKMMLERQGMETMRDTDVLGCLVFVQRLEIEHSNGRRKGRAFLDFLRSSFPLKPGENPGAPAAEESRIQL